MDDADARIIAELQSGLPDSATPYADAARTLGMSADELLDRLRRMRESGLLRSVRAVLDQRKVGFSGNALAAWTIPESRVEEVGALFAERAEVSHCVLRRGTDDWSYNLYTMIHTDTMEHCRNLVDEMTEASGITERVVLETVRELKKTAPRYL